MSRHGTHPDGGEGYADKLVKRAESEPQPRYDPVPTTPEIIERLRALANMGYPFVSGSVPALLRDAADALERESKRLWLP